MAAKIKVTNVKITDLTPIIKSPAKHLESLIPRTLFPKKISFDIEGASNAIANGIRRTVANELLATAMWFEYENYSSNNPFSINTMILTRIRLIPIDQKTPIDAVLELDVQNKSDKTAYVYSNQFRIVDPGTKNADGSKASPLKNLPFNETFPLFNLEPGRYLKISKITMRQDYGFNFAGHSLVSNATSIALDQKPINTYESKTEGLPSRQSNPRSWRISFITNGAMDPREIIFQACDNIIARMRLVESLIYSIASLKDMYTLSVVGETDTVGNLLMRTIVDLYPNVTVSYETETTPRKMLLKLQSLDDDIGEIITGATTMIIKQYNDTKKFFE